jgi:hypothetical protein
MKPWVATAMCVLVLGASEWTVNAAAGSWWWTLAVIGATVPVTLLAVRYHRTGVARRGGVPWR